MAFRSYGRERPHTALESKLPTFSESLWVQTSHGFHKSSNRCAGKRIVCLSDVSYRFCFNTTLNSIAYGSVKYCPESTVCCEKDETKICVEADNYERYNNTADFNLFHQAEGVLDSVQQENVRKYTSTQKPVGTTAKKNKSTTSFPQRIKHTTKTQKRRKRPFLTVIKDYLLKSSNRKQSNKIKKKSNKTKTRGTLKPSNTVKKSTLQKLKNSKPSTKFTTLTPTQLTTTNKTLITSTSTTPIPFSPKTQSTTTSTTSTPAPPTISSTTTPILSSTTSSPATIPAVITSRASSAFTTPLFSNPPTTNDGKLALISSTSKSPCFAAEIPTTPSPCSFFQKWYQSSTAYSLRTTSIETTTVSTGGRPAICKIPAKYPAEKCYEYHECKPVMWWYKWLLMRCKSGYAFDPIASTCLENSACVY
ncbi:unnamed protein product [Phyllotreta striolata]|uniref:Chitin-binding type-2 domain-containing protein n=1 Tax=Phyllotreta striolata TaxID=444603 RepID=A0A9N9TU74_PHYSR|nr:unnamed protein product [Phyllotreta striolata]